MKTINFTQGSPEWHQHRASHFNASDAPAMMGCSPYKSRTQLLKEFKTGIYPEVDAATQRRFDDGHRFERLARSLAEEIIGEELYPVVGTNGKYSASFDGLTMMEDVAFEHKTLNDTLRSVDSLEQLPRAYKVQMEHQLLVSGAEKCLFMASKWDESGELIEQKHFWYEMDGFLRKQIVDGWSQFESDLEEFEPEPEIIQAKADPVMALPSLSIQVGGSISIQSNLEKFGERLKSFIGEANAKPETDQDFANLEQACKVLKEAEDALKQAEANALAQTASVDEMRRTVAFLGDMARTNRLTFEKLVKSEKEARKVAIVSKAKIAFTDHFNGLQSEIKGVQLIVENPGFAEAIKGKKTLSSMQDSVDSMLANSKIEADRIAKDLREKLSWFKENADGFGFLFSDLQSIVGKAMDDFQLVITTRVESHKKSEAEKLEKERERIRLEEEAKAQRELAEKEKRIAEEAAKVERDRIAEEQAEAKRKADEIVMAAHEQAYREQLERDNQKDLEHATQVKKMDDPIDENGFLSRSHNAKAVFTQIADEVQPAPARIDIIEAIANEWNVSSELAEQWLVYEFGK